MIGEPCLLEAVNDTVFPILVEDRINSHLVNQFKGLCTIESLGI